MTDWEICLDEYEQRLESAKHNGDWATFFEIKEEMTLLLASQKRN